MDIIDIAIAIIVLLIFWGVCWSVGEHELVCGRRDLLVFLETIDPYGEEQEPVNLQKLLMLSSYQVHCVLTSLEREGYIEHQWVADKDGCPRSHYKITRLGSTILHLCAETDENSVVGSDTIELVVDNTLDTSPDDEDNQAAEA